LTRSILSFIPRRKRYTVDNCPRDMLLINRLISHLGFQEHMDLQVSRHLPDPVRHTLLSPAWTEPTAARRTVQDSASKISAQLVFLRQVGHLADRQQRKGRELV
jgi:hypothetical protein